MSFFEEQMDDWAANNFKGSPDDYYCGELAPWRDKFTDTSKPMKTTAAATQTKSQRRNAQRKRAAARKKAETAQQLAPAQRGAV